MILFFLWDFRTAAHCCQRLTNAVAIIIFKIGIYILNYFLDDLASADTFDSAQFRGYFRKNVALRKSRINFVPLVLLRHSLAFFLILRQ